MTVILVSVAIVAFHDFSHLWGMLDPRERQIGERIKAIIGDTLRSHALFAFTRKLVMPIREFDELISGASKEAVNPDLKAYFPL